MLTDDEKKRFFELLEEVTTQDGIGRLRRYSGRAMWGKECVAITGDYLNPFDLALRLADRAEDFGFQIGDLPSPDTDSLGRGIVIYWPKIEWPEGTPEPRDEFDEDDEY